MHWYISCLILSLHKLKLPKYTDRFTLHWRPKKKLIFFGSESSHEDDSSI